MDAQRVSQIDCNCVLAMDEPLCPRDLGLDASHRGVYADVGLDACLHQGWEQLAQSAEDRVILRGTFDNQRRHCDENSKQVVHARVHARVHGSTACQVQLQVQLWQLRDQRPETRDQRPEIRDQRPEGGGW